MVVTVAPVVRSGDVVPFDAEGAVRAILREAEGERLEQDRRHQGTDHDLLIRLDERTGTILANQQQDRKDYQQLEARVLTLEQMITAVTSTAQGKGAVTDRLWIIALALVGPMTVVAVKVADRFI